MVFQAFILAQITKAPQKPGYKFKRLMSAIELHVVPQGQTVIVKSVFIFFPRKSMGKVKGIFSSRTREDFELGGNAKLR